MAASQVRDTAARLVTQFAMSVRDRVLGVVLDSITQLEDQLSRHDRKFKQLEARMGAVGDAVRQFRAQVDAETNRISGVLDDLRTRLDQGDAAAAAEVSAELAPVIDTLRELGTGSPADPVPAPDETTDDGDDQVPADI